jgi:hypothetical protein
MQLSIHLNDVDTPNDIRADIAADLAFEKSCDQLAIPLILAHCRADDMAALAQLAQTRGVGRGKSMP